MKRLLIALFIAAASVVGFAQQSYTLELDSAATTTDSLRITEGMIPGAIYTDSLRTPTLAHFQVSFGNLATRRWYNVSSVSDSVLYEIKLSDSTFIPLAATSMAPVIGTATSETPAIWFRVVVTTAQTYLKKIFVKLNPFK